MSRHARERERAPELSLRAVHTGQQLDRGWLAGRPLVLVFHVREEVDAAMAVVQEVRDAYPYATQVVTANVVDVRMFPKTYRKAVDGDLERAYEAAAAELPGDKDPESHVLILPDYDGSARDEFGAPAPGPSVVVLDADWRVLLRDTGPAAGEHSVAVLTGLVAPPPRKGRWDW